MTKRHREDTETVQWELPLRLQGNGPWCTAEEAAVASLAVLSQDEKGCDGSVEISEAVLLSHARRMSALRATLDFPHFAKLRKAHVATKEDKPLLHLVYDASPLTAVAFVQQQQERADSRFVGEVLRQVAGAASVLRKLGLVDEPTPESFLVYFPASWSVERNDKGGPSRGWSVRCSLEAPLVQWRLDHVVSPFACSTPVDALAKFAEWTGVDLALFAAENGPDTGQDSCVPASHFLLGGESLFERPSLEVRKQLFSCGLELKCSNRAIGMCCALVQSVDATGQYYHLVRPTLALCRALCDHQALPADVAADPALLKYLAQLVSVVPPDLVTLTDLVTDLLQAPCSGLLQTVLLLTHVAAPPLSGLGQASACVFAAEQMMQRRLAVPPCPALKRAHWRTWLASAAAIARELPLACPYRSRVVDWLIEASSGRKNFAQPGLQLSEES